MVSLGPRFIEVKNDGTLWWWHPKGLSYPIQLGTGWQDASLVSGLSDFQVDTGSSTVPATDFVEVKSNGELWYWESLAGGSYEGWRVGTGWGDARMIAALDAWNFVEVKSNGQLWQWTLNGSTYTGTPVGWNWGDARLIAGISPARFVEVKNNGELWTWASAWTPTGPSFDGYISGNNWADARLLGAGDTHSDGYPDSFVEVSYDGRLSEWDAQPDGTFSYQAAGQGWSDARLLGS